MSTTNLTDYEHQIPVEGVDRLSEKEYEPYQHRHVEHPNTFSGALMHLLKSSLGTGILAIPSALAAAGMVVGGVGTLLTGILCTYTIHLLVWSSQEICKKEKVPSLGFGDTAQGVFKYGPKMFRSWSYFAKLFVEVALLLTYYSTIAVYVVFISESVQKMVNYHHPSVDDWPIQYYMLMLLIPLIPCCQIRELKHLVPFSLIANTTMIVAFCITLYYMFSGIGDVQIQDRKLFNGVTKIPLFFSTVMFAMEGIGTMLPIENSLLKPQFLGCPGILNTGMAFVVTLYTLIGIFGYIRFGDNVNANVISDLPDADIAAQIAKMCITVTVFFTCMLQFYVPCDIVWTLLRDRVPKKYHNITQVVFRVLAVLIITGIAAGVPKLNAIISLVGSLFLSILGLFVPVVLETFLIIGGDGDFGVLKWRLWKNLLISVLAWFALFSGSYYAIKELIED